MNKYFSTYQAQNNQPFQIKEKDKEYHKYLKRIESIVHKKTVQDTSPQKYMRQHKMHKESVHKLAKSEIEETINSENAILLSKIMSVKNRNKTKSPVNHTRTDTYGDQDYNNIFHPPMHIKRQLEIERINQENQEMAARLAKTYTMSRTTQSQSLSKLPGASVPGGTKASLYLKNRKLPQLNQISALAFTEDQKPGNSRCQLREKNE